MRNGRVFCFPIQVNHGKHLVIIGGCKDQELEIYDLHNGMKEHNPSEVDELEKYLFFQLTNYTKDLTLSTCSFA